MSNRKPGAGWFDEKEDVTTNTPEQRAAALEVVKAFAPTASLAELVAMLGLAEEVSA